ncbi:CCA tRNA nucleotidyltransferase [Candidatus Peregrinibacteria bacterium]|nr:CCA tRNA nucleotidyltransferase [Candidatus Peregrinibacteria bacterium]
MPLSREIIDRTLATKHGEGAYKVVELLTDAGEEAWWVGGGVRDMMLGQPPKDIDITTSALSETVRKLFPKCDETGAEFGSMIVSHGGCRFEVTTLREDDAASDGRHPESVTFTNKKERDALRRDITINAFYWNPISSELFDPFDGEKDLNERLIRIIGDPEERIKHDALRLLRVVRFRAAINGQYEPRTFQTIHKRAKDIAILSGMRRFQEVEKMLLGPHPSIAFEDLWETDILEYLIPELHACKGVAQPIPPHGEGDVWNHIMRIIGSFTADHGADTRWAALFHDIGKPVTFSIEDDRIHFNEHAAKGGEIARIVLDRLQCTAVRRDKICWLVQHHMMMSTFFEIDDERKAHWYYHPWFIELLQLFWLDIAATDPPNFSLYDAIINDYNHYLDAHPRPARPLLDGNAVMEMLGLPPGEEVGRVLKLLHEAQIKGRVQSKKEAMEFVRKQN